MLPVKKLLALARGNAGLQADEVKVVVDELDSRIKELEADRHPCINVMSERIEELERERDELIKIDKVKTRVTNRVIRAHKKLLDEANALLRECRELLSCYQGAAEMILDCDKYKLVAGHTGALKGLNKARTDTDCRLAAHLKKGDKGEPQVGSKAPLTSRAAAVRARTKIQKARQLVNGIKCAEKTELFDLLYDAETCLSQDGG